MMDAVDFHDNNDNNIYRLVDSRSTNCRNDCNRRFQMHSSLIRRLSREKELEGHEGCINSLAWNSKGSLLISGSDDTRVNIWSYPNWNIMHSIDTGHSANIFCTKFLPETNDEVVLSGAADAEVRLFRMSSVCDKGAETSSTTLPAVFHCHSGRVKKLAVEDGNPNVVWSASEDGTLRQHDLRECSSCPPAGSSRQECRSVLLDLRCGAKKSLSAPPKLSFSLKSCDINHTRPHLLLVGGSDAFARLYDRRMLPSLSSCRLRMSPPPCVNFFCPIHLSDNEKLSSHLTHVTFSPNGEEVLLNYSGEHVYLMDVNFAHRDTMQYCPGDLSNMMTFSPLKNSLALPQPGSATFSSRVSMNRKLVSGLLKCNKLYGLAEKCLSDHSNLFIGIEACNEALDRNYNVIDLVLRHDFLCIRAALLLKRLWKHDAHIAVRDCYEAWKINPSSFKSHLYMSEALSKLGKHKEALEFAIAAQRLSPSSIEVEERVNDARVHLAEDESETNADDAESINSPPQRDGLLSLLDLLYGSRHQDYTLGRRRLRTENDDSDEELELGMEASGLGYHDYELESMNHGGPSESPVSSPPNMEADYQPEPVVDMKQRYVGHCNVGTDIKQASFLGREGTLVASGSDDGRLFIWEKRTGRLVKVLLGDDAVVNCVQCHPNDCTVATSGIDSTVKIWTPRASVQSIVAGGVIGSQPSNLLDVMEKNQLKMSRIQEAVLIFGYYGS